MGDDIPHAPIPVFDLPDFIASDPPTGSDITPDTPIDFVFVDFIEDQLLEIINGLQTDKVYTSSDALKYSDLLSNAVLGVFAQQAWN